MANKNKVLVKSEEINFDWFKAHLNKEVLIVDEDGKMRVVFCIYSKKYDEYRIKEKDSEYEYFATLDQFFDYDSGYYDGYYQFYTVEKQHPKFYKNIVK